MIQMPAYFESGFCVREPSWHGEETLLADYPENWDEARMAAGLMWEPRKVTGYRMVNDPITDQLRDRIEAAVLAGTDIAISYEELRAMQGSHAPIDEIAIIERDDTGAYLGTVSKDYPLITHAQMGEIMETILGQTNVKFETAGSVKGGRQVYALVRLDEPYVAPGDEHGPNGEPVQTFPFLALLNSHDGAGALKVVMTQVRVVCWNTVQAADADGERHGRQFSFRHVGNPMERIEDAKAALMGLREDAVRWRAIADELYGVPVDQAHVSQYLSEFIPAPPDGVVSDRVKGNIQRDRAKFMHLLEQPTNAHLAGTALGVYNASLEFLDHIRTYQSRDTYLGRTVLKAEPMKTKALTLVRKTLVGVN